ncbi:AAA family ATPase [Gemmata sp. JC717]|uniref:AAA family ATPase n=1 Tax=Gemmata algarum TaxID=2975278 RepID=UPI0021BA7221|nr:ATP-binding protein [Gemmata algarum]MDY3556927.1 AAA family ATPase [Gemmata algarum]
MIRSLTFENYRGFPRFEMGNLGRVNLIVGTNNAGKTSVLEAIHILEAPGEISPIWATQTRRGEDIDDPDAARAGRQIDIRRLYHGHNIPIGNRLELTAQTDRGVDRFSLVIAESSPEARSPQPTLFDPTDTANDSDLLPRATALGVHWEHGQSGNDLSAVLELSRRGGVPLDSVRTLGRISESARVPIRFITAAALSAEVVIELFEEVVLTPLEDFVIEALRIIEPSIARIATSGAERRRTMSSRNINIRGGLLVRCEGIGDRIPIGSMGDGIWRLLGLALALAKTEGGILLIDEIDTGLHYSVMENMWRLVNQTAKRHRIQVFATTHSRDCYESLATVCRDTVSKNSEVTIQRVERGKAKATSYSEKEIVAAAERGMEVR